MQNSSIIENEVVGDNHERFMIIMKESLTKIILLSVCCGSFMCIPILSSSKLKASRLGYDNCRYWESKVAPIESSVEEKKSINEDEEANILEAIDCLLKLEGDKRVAKFGGAAHPRVSRIFDEMSKVEVAALYYISYLFYQKWDHSNAVFLVDKQADKLNTEEAIKEAYRLYREWFQKVKTIGLSNARAAKLDPLTGSNIRWY